jgi:alkylhydroperoxidase family enzyme
LLVAQLAAVRSGCGYCAERNRHLALKAGLTLSEVDAVVDPARVSHFSEAERAALALADAVTGFADAEGGFPAEILVRARCHFGEREIVALVATVAAEHFFDPATGRLGRDALAPAP